MALLSDADAAMMYESVDRSPAGEGRAEGELGVEMTRPSLSG